MARSTSHQRLRLMLLSCGLLLVGTACSSRTAGYPDLGPVISTVTLDGKPLPDVTVMFQPENGRASTGLTDAEGRYDLTFTEVAKGAKVGRHTVSFSQEIAEDDIPATMRPPKYLGHSFEFEVTTAPNVFDFDLAGEPAKATTLCHRYDGAHSRSCCLFFLPRSPLRAGRPKQLLGRISSSSSPMTMAGPILERKECGRISARLTSMPWPLLARG